MKENVEDQDCFDLQHLRRFAKARFLPRHILGKKAYLKEIYTIPRAWESTPPMIMQAPSTTVWEYSRPMKNRAVNNCNLLHLLICPTKAVSREDLYKLLIDAPPFCSSPESWAFPLELREVVVPKLAPTSPEQALDWSNKYWPCFYRKTNPFGAHPGAIIKAEEELQNPPPGFMGAEEALRLAQSAAIETENRGHGLGPGCVILDRNENGTEIIAVAGDARKKPLPGGKVTDTEEGGCNGNVMGHAVMRAIGMVGRKRLRCASQPISNRAAKAERGFELCGLDHDESARDAFFLDLPLTPLEEQHFAKDNLKADGYLCLRLEVFLTHEPCVMCSMALVHSRVGRVIFEKRMSQTGGLTAEMASNDTGPVGLGYGLAWRKELNWQFMCWEYAEPRKTNKNTSGNVPDPASPSSTYTITCVAEDEKEEEKGEEAKADEGVMSTSVNHKANIDSFASTHV